MSMDLKAFSRMKIMVLGDVMLDRYLWGEVKRISPEAPVPVVNIRERSHVLGGAGNVAANLTGLGSQPLLIGVCGNDENGKKLHQILEEKKIASRLVTDLSRQTITKTRVMGKNQQLFRLDEEDIAILSPETEKRLFTEVTDHLDACQAVIFSDYGKGLFQTPGFCQTVIEQCREKKIPVFIDPKGKAWERYAGAACVTPNLSELGLVYAGEMTSDMDSIKKAAQSICDTCHFDTLLLTLGERGMCLVEKNATPVIIPAKAREVYDVSGAGDTVIATLTLGVATGFSVKQAAILANTAAGVVVGKIGTQPIFRKELEAAIIQNEMESRLTLSGKTASLDAALLQVQAWRASGDSIVFTNGCYDLLHPGHIDLLNRSRALGDRLIVGLNTDSSVRRLKGKTRPILSETDRSAVLGGLSAVDLVVLFDQDTPLHLIEALKPDILVKGADYKIENVVGREVVESYGGRVVLQPLLQGYSTTGIVNRLLSDLENKPSGGETP